MGGFLDWYDFLTISHPSREIISNGFIDFDNSPHSGNFWEKVPKLGAIEVDQTTVTDLARFLGRSTFTPFSMPT